MVPGFVLSLADGALLLLTVLFYSYFDLSWPLMTSEDAQNLRALWKSSKEPHGGYKLFIMHEKCGRPDSN